MNPKTLYQIAMEKMNDSISIYLQLSEATNDLTNITPNSVSNPNTRELFLAGLGLVNTEMSTEQAVEEWKRRQALKFDTEMAVTFSVYQNIRQVGALFFDQAYEITDGFRSFSSESIYNHPYLLPIFQHLSGIFSKSALKKQIGSVSDTLISRPASERLAKLLTERVNPNNINRGEVLQRLEGTLEGIVRDLVGRILLESIVENALKQKGITFQRESDYKSLPGVVYNFRADFVIPDANNSLAFIEVRKSSSRHASLYAKDKMFSAINWKGYNSNLLGVLVVDGEWTGQTLRVMANVFDYVIPIERINELADTLNAYINGDRSKLKWLIKFSINSIS
ncbi:MAG: hypothetical protein SWJ54_01705 [Cyanobacteriota bacterium]|nr:hypothetical protein [Cyanobacteriota bacterium]